jgi:hypothetical protein
VTLSRGRGLRLWVLLNLAIFLGVVVPGLVGHPYPRAVKSYVEWGGLALYLASSLCQLLVATRSKRR